ncbi:unnamed protein product [Caenorhabditis bovis]|uniref:RUN domain-containing protein n=1 Tax=Caenorhabditis bovis TaxID=2654633 RepID=A0A8S1EI37_9PELO|nr:unnamed protein product [Caenorhabditis bovis]
MMSEEEAGDLLVSLEETLKSQNSEDTKEVNDTLDFYDTMSETEWKSARLSSSHSDELGSLNDTLRVQQLEEEQERLNNSLFSLSSHFAQVQFRIKQMNEANPEDRERMLKELQEFAFKGCADMHELKRMRSESEGGSDVLEKQRERQNELLKQLREQVEDLERIAYENGEGNMPSTLILQKQKAVLDKLREKVELNLDMDKMSQAEIQKHVDEALKQMLNPFKEQEQLVDQLQTQIIDLERFVNFLQKESSESSSQSTPVRSFGSSLIAAAKPKQVNSIFGLMGCSAGRFQKNQLKASLKGNHYGDERAHLQLAVDATQQVLEKYTLLSVDNSVKEEPCEIEVENDDVFERSEEEVVSVVRKQLCPALKALLEHGMLQETVVNRRIPGFGCFIGKPENNNFDKPTKLGHIWDVIMFFYTIKSGIDTTDAPVRKLSQSFKLESVGGKSITSKQILLTTIENIVSTHAKLRRSKDAHWKAFVSAAMNEKKLPAWLRIIFRTRQVVEMCYNSWSYVARTGCEELYTFLEGLHKYNVHLPITSIAGTITNLFIGTSLGFVYNASKDNVSDGEFRYTGVVRVSNAPVTQIEHLSALELLMVISGTTLSEISLNLATFFENEFALFSSGLAMIVNCEGISTKPPLLFDDSTILSSCYRSPNIFLLCKQSLTSFGIDDVVMDEMLPNSCDLNVIANIEGEILVCNANEVFMLAQASFKSRVDRLIAKGQLEKALKECEVEYQKVPEDNIIELVREIKQKLAFKMIDEQDWNNAYQYLMSGLVNPLQVVEKYEKDGLQNLEFLELYLSDVQKLPFVDAAIKKKIDETRIKHSIFIEMEKWTPGNHLTMANILKEQKGSAEKIAMHLMAAHQTDEAMRVWETIPNFDPEEAISTLKFIDEKAERVKLLKWFLDHKWESYVFQYLKFSDFTPLEQAAIFEKSPCDSTYESWLKDNYHLPEILPKYVSFLCERTLQTGSEGRRELRHVLLNFVGKCQKIDDEVKRNLNVNGFTMETRIIEYKPTAEYAERTIDLLLNEEDCESAEIYVEIYSSEYPSLIRRLFSYYKENPNIPDCREKMGRCLAGIKNSVVALEILNQVPNDLKMKETNDSLKNIIYHKIDKFDNDVLQKAAQHKFIKSLAGDEFRPVRIEESAICEACNRDLQLSPGNVTYLPSGYVIHTSCIRYPGLCPVTNMIFNA